MLGSGLGLGLGLLLLGGDLRRPCVIVTGEDGDKVHGGAHLRESKVIVRVRVRVGARESKVIARVRVGVVAQ